MAARPRCDVARRGARRRRGRPRRHRQHEVTRVDEGGEAQGRVRGGLQGQPQDSREDALQGVAPTASGNGPQHRSGGLRPCEQEGQLQSGA